jgi:hypothetical protein
MGPPPIFFTDIAHRHQGEDGMLRLTAVAAFLCLVTAPALAFKDEPSGFDQAKFSMTVEQVKKLYPGMSEMDPRQVDQLYALPGMTNYHLSGVKVEGFKDPADLTFRFSKDRLWLVRVHLSQRDSDAMVDQLTKRHGEPTFGTSVAGWAGQRVMIATTPQLQFFEVFDRQISAETAPLLFGQGEHPGAGAPRTPGKVGTPQAPPGAAGKPAPGVQGQH